MSWYSAHPLGAFTHTAAFTWPCQIGRNSWGTYWGELGWFKIRRGHNDCQIESACSWAVPEHTWETQWKGKF